MSKLRPDSKLEAREVDAYVKSCVNFKSNVSFSDVAKYGANALVAPTVLLIGTTEQLRDKSVMNLPIYCPVVAEAIKRIADEKTINVMAQLRGSPNAYTNISVVALPTKSTRYNCPFRVDAITSAVSAVVGLAGEGEQRVDIFVRTALGSEPAVANAVARGSPHSYTAKKGDAATGFFTQRIKFNVIFASRAAFTGEKYQGKAITVAELEAQCASVQLCQRLVDTPTNILDTVVFAEIATQYGAMLGAQATVIQGNDLRERGYGGMYGVGKCAQYPPHLVTLKYINPRAERGAKNIALVGKGIVYDCGGLAIKPAVHMCNMKTDMGGAAAVFSGFVALVRSMKSQKDHYAQIGTLSVTLCLAENAIGPDAFRNDDILIMKSGKTVEVQNTDAEGRIVLGDGVFHATNEQDFIPDILIDMATLTGAQGIATGLNHAGIYTNSGEAERDFVEAGRRCGDTCCPVLYCPEYHQPEYKSPAADMRNIMACNTNASVSCAGFFIESHISERFKGDYVHVDLAFPSSTKSGGTGYGVSLLTEFMKKF